MSNPIASETPHGTVLHEGHYGPVHCHCSECDYLVDSAEAQLQSDPSGKGARAFYREKYPSIVHDWADAMDFADFYAASLRQQLSDTVAQREGFKTACDLKLDEIDKLRTELSEAQKSVHDWQTTANEVAAERDEAQGKVLAAKRDARDIVKGLGITVEPDLNFPEECAAQTWKNKRADDLEGKVSQLEAERARLQVARIGDSEIIGGHMCEITTLKEQVSVLTKERDTARETWRCFNCDFSTSDRAEALAHFGDADEEQSLCQTWAGLDADGRASEYQSQISERNDLESRLSAVSEVVRDADEGILFERAMKADIIDHNCYAAGMAGWGARSVGKKFVPRSPTTRKRNRKKVHDGKLL